MENARLKVRYINMILLLVLLILTLAAHRLYGQSSALRVLSTWMPLSGKVIIIDPGHGGVDGGATFNRILEKDINLEVSLKLKKMLEKEGANVIMTRSKDIALDYLNNKSDYRHKRDLIARVDIINNTMPDIFLSIHVNAERSSPKTGGPMVFYYFESVESRQLAQYLQKNLEDAYINDGHAVPRRKPYGNGSLFILKNTKPPGVIVEMGFITNSRDRQLLTSKDFQNKIAKAIVAAIREYFS